MFDNLGSDKNTEIRVLKYLLKIENYLIFMKVRKVISLKVYSEVDFRYMKKIFVQNHEAGELFYLDCGDLKFVSNRCKKKRVKAIIYI